MCFINSIYSFNALYGLNQLDDIETWSAPYVFIGRALFIFFGGCMLFSNKTILNKTI